MMLLRRLNDRGIERFRELINRLDEAVADDLQALREDGELTEAVRPVRRVEARRFVDREAMVHWLHELLGDISGVERDRGVWSWLSLLLIDELVPVDKNGARKKFDESRLIANPLDYRKYYRHLLAGPFHVYLAHQDDLSRARVLLCQPLHRPGELVEQLASSQDILTNRAVIEVATRLYVDRVSGLPKSGAGGKESGGVRRLVDLIRQLDLTWDLYGMEADAFMALLPAEFARFQTD